MFEPLDEIEHPVGPDDVLPDGLLLRDARDTARFDQFPGPRGACLRIFISPKLQVTSTPSTLVSYPPRVGGSDCRGGSRE